MSLATRCPQCQTLFRVALGQLQMHEGQVRCGRCQHVFSGIDHLTAADSEFWTKLDLEDKPAKPKPQPAEPGFLTKKETKKKKPRWLALGPAPTPVKIALLAFGLILGLQLLWWQRVAILQYAPGFGTWVAQRPESMQWMFSAPADRSLQLEGSGLTREGETRLRVDLTLLNTAELPSRWPHVRVLLKDSQGLEVASKMLKPTDYLKIAPEIRPAAGPIAPGETVEVVAILQLEELKKQIPGLAATGFQVQLYDDSVDLE